MDLSKSSNTIPLQDFEQHVQKIRELNQLSLLNLYDVNEILEGIINNGIAKAKDKFPVWQTVTLGRFVDGESLLKSAHCTEAVKNVYKNRNRMLSISLVNTKVRLIKVTAKDLGFDQPPSYEDFFHRASFFELFLCTPEVGAELRIERPNEHLDVYIAMPLMDGDKWVFRLTAGKLTTFRTYGGLVDIDQSWVFQKRD